MKGKLLQTKTGWIIRYQDLLRLYPFSQYGMKEIHIHPDIQKYYFLDEDADGADVEFEIVTDDTGFRCAKLVRPEVKSKGIDLDKLEKKLDAILETETAESFHKWLESKRGPIRDYHSPKVDELLKEIEDEEVSKALDFLAEQAQELDMGYEGYIGDETDTDKIEGILDNSLNSVRTLAQTHWEGCDGCDENDKNFWIKGFISGYNIADTICINCDEEKSTHNICMDCIGMLIKENQVKEFSEEQVLMAIQKARVTNTENLMGTGVKLHKWSDDEILKLIKTKL
jgi:hypothetical protein